MPVELDVANPNGRLASGIFPEVVWPVHRSETTLFVPASSAARTTEATFVVRIHDGATEWVKVLTGEVDGTEARNSRDSEAGVVGFARFTEMKFRIRSVLV